MVKKSNIIKMIVIMLILVFGALILASCAKEAVSYCPFCGKSGIEEISVYNTTTGITEIRYQCTNNKCGKSFGAGQAPK